MKITGKELAEQVDPSSVSTTGGATFLCLAADKEYEINEPLYNIPLPNLKTTDGYQQYLSRKNHDPHWFASRLKNDLIQTYTLNELDQVPTAYRQYAKKVDGDYD